MNETDRDDNKIIDSVLEGRIQDYEELVEKYKGKIFSIVFNRIPVNDVAELSNETFLRAFRNLHTYGKKQPFENWISSIAVRACCDYWRKKGRTPMLAPDGASATCADWLESAARCRSVEDFDRESSKKEAAETLELILGRLPPEDRMILELVYFEERPLKEAAELLGWGLSKSKIRVMRAKIKMRRIIGTLFKKGVV